MSLVNTRKYAHVTNVKSISITGLKETLLQETSNTVGYHTITFHLSESKTTIATSTLDRLSSEDLNRPTSTGMDLIVHHVLETLVVDGAVEDVSL